MKIEKEMIISVVMSKFPESKKVFFKHKLACFSCQGAQAESIERCAHMHGLDTNLLVDELNLTINKENSVY